MLIRQKYSHGSPGCARRRTGVTALPNLNRHHGILVARVWGGHRASLVFREESHLTEESSNILGYLFVGIPGGNKPACPTHTPKIISYSGKRQGGADAEQGEGQGPEGKMLSRCRWKAQAGLPSKAMTPSFVSLLRSSDKEDKLMTGVIRGWRSGVKGNWEEPASSKGSVHSPVQLDDFQRFVALQFGADSAKPWKGKSIRHRLLQLSGHSHSMTATCGLAQLPPVLSSVAQAPLPTYPLCPHSYHHPTQENALAAECKSGGLVTGLF